MSDDINTVPAVPDERRQPDAFAAAAEIVPLVTEKRTGPVRFILAFLFGFITTMALLSAAARLYR